MCSRSVWNTNWIKANCSYVDLVVMRPTLSCRQQTGTRNVSCLFLRGKQMAPFRLYTVCDKSFSLTSLFIANK